MTISSASTLLRFLVITLVLSCCFLLVRAGDSDFPARPNPPRLVNDLAHTMSASQVQQLEDKLVNFDKTTSTQITIVTIKNLGGYEVAQYAVELANKWGIGQKSKNNGVLLLAAIDDHRVNISTGYGLEGALTDATSGRIIRNEITPQFKAGNFYEGFNKGADAIIAATKGEYTADPQEGRGERMPAPAIIIIILVIYFILWIMSKFRGGGGSYMSGRGHRGWGGGFIGGSGFGGGSWGGGSSGGGGFGGFGGGSFGGGGASGSW
jgi:uncharacterized protein